jgi:hypothetical protein
VHSFITNRLRTFLRKFAWRKFRALSHFFGILITRFVKFAEMRAELRWQTIDPLTAIERTLLAKGDDFDEPKRGLSSFPRFKERNLRRRPWPGLPGLTAKPRPNCWDQRTQPTNRGSSRRRELLWTTGKAFCLRPVNSSRRRDRSIEPSSAAPVNSVSCRVRLLEK